MANSRDVLRGSCCLQLGLRNFFGKNSGFVVAGDVVIVGFRFCLRSGNFLMDSWWGMGSWIPWVWQEAGGELGSVN